MQDAELAGAEGVVERAGERRGKRSRGRWVIFNWNRFARESLSGLEEYEPSQWEREYDAFRDVGSDADTGGPRSSPVR